MRKSIYSGLVAIALLLTSFMSTMTMVSAAGAASFSLTPGASNVTTGGNITVTIKVTTAEAVNTVSANINYDAAQLQYVSINTADSAFDFPLAQSNVSGKVTVARGIMAGGSVSGTKTVAAVTFKVLMGPGTTNLSFAGDSAIVRISDSQNIWNGVTAGGTYTVPQPTTPPPTSTPTPTPTSTPTSPTTSGGGSSSPASSTPTSSTPQAGTTARRTSASAPTLTEQAVDPSAPIPVSSPDEITGNLVAVKIVDAKQNPIVDAEVTISDQTARTNAAGVASFIGLEAGTYEVSVKSSQGHVKGSVTVLEGDTAAQVQEYTINVKRRSPLIYVAITGVIVGLVALLLAMLRQRRGGSITRHFPFKGKKSVNSQLPPVSPAASSVVSPVSSPVNPVVNQTMTSPDQNVSPLDKIKTNIPAPSTVIHPTSTPDEPK